MSNKIDLSNVTEVKCICCGFRIKELHGRFEKDVNRPEGSMWDGGTVERCYMPYGSNKDGNIYVIGICDGCIDKNKERVIYAGEYI